MTSNQPDADREFAIADAVHHDLHIAPGPYGTLVIWLHHPTKPDQPEAIGNQAQLHPLLWAVLAAAIPTRDDDADGEHGHCDTCGAPCDGNGCTRDHTHAAALDINEAPEPSHWYAEGYSVGRYGTPWPALDGLDDPDLDEFDRGHTAGRAAAAAHREG